MNYCPACRRHLNGALACAGCGTPAQYLMHAAPPAPDVPVAPYAAEGASAQPSTLADVYADSLVVLSGPGEGRSGARRRVTHRRRRRTVLTIGLGLVLATGGTLAAARIAADGERSDRAATVVLTDDAAPQQPVPAPDAPTGAAPTAKGSGKASGAAKTGAAAAKTAGPGTASPGGTQPGPTSSEPAPATSVPASGTPRPGGTVGPTGTGKPKPSGTASPTGTPVAPPPPPPPSPSPTPTKTCSFWDSLFGGC